MTTTLRRDPRKGPSHADVVAACRHYLAVLGAWDLKVWGGPMQRPGVPDIIACYKGRTVAIEAKVAKDRLSIEQQREKAKLEAAGAVYVIAKEEGALAVQRALQEAGLEPPGVLV